MDSGVDGVSAAGLDRLDVALDDIANPNSQAARTEDGYSVALTDAIERATDIPTAGVKTDGPRAEMSGTASGDFGAEKRDLISDAQIEGAPAAAPGEETDQIESVAGAMRDLMNDLTTWQVTWNMAQTAQKDVTHILKSS